MSYQVTTRTLAKQPAAACSATLPADRVGPWLANAYAEIWRYLQRLNVNAAGPPYARYTFMEDRMSVEAGFPVDRPVAAEGSIQTAWLPGGPVAVTMHIGAYEALEDAYKAVVTWLAERGEEPAGPHWEVYYSDPAQEPDSANWRTEVIVPYVTAGTQARTER